MKNLERHGIDFEDATAIWLGPVLEVLSTQLFHGEERFLAVGQCEGVRGSHDHGGLHITRHNQAAYFGQNSEAQ